MNVAILIASVIAAVAALASFVLAELRRRPQLKLEFTGSFSASETDITVLVRVSNEGERRVSQIDLFLLAAGEILSADRRLARIGLDPGEWQEVPVPLARPGRVTLGPPTMKPVLEVPIAVLAWFGRHRALVRHPDNPPGNDDAFSDILKRNLRNARPPGALPARDE